MTTRNLIQNVKFACSSVACYLKKYIAEIKLSFEDSSQNEEMILDSLLNLIEHWLETKRVSQFSCRNIVGLYV